MYICIIYVLYSFIPQDGERSDLVGTGCMPSLTTSSKQT